MVSPPSVGSHLVVSVYPKEKVLVLRLHRPEVLNAVNAALTVDIAKVLDWFEAEPSLWCCIVTGTGRAFCAGSDLKQMRAKSVDVTPTKPGSEGILAQPDGFASISLRRMRKPIIAAVNGLALGGGAEIVVNCDIIIGHPGAIFGYPEVRRGLVAAMGGIPHVAKRDAALVPYLLTGENIPPALVSRYVFTETVELDQVMPTAFKWAAKIVECGPEAVQITKEQINMAILDGMGVSAVVATSARDPASATSFAGANFEEGIKAFTEKRRPTWKDPQRQSKL